MSHPDHVLHDWSDEGAIRILRRANDAATPASKLLVVESVVRSDNAPDMGKLVDLEMLVMTNGGRERTEPEFAAILQAAGWRLARVVPTRAPMCVIEATRA